MLRHVSALTVGHLQGALKFFFLAFAGCVSTCVVGIVHMIELTVMNIKLLTPNVNYSGRTAPLTSKVAFYIFIQQI